ncbi:hypothetical protein LTR66_015914, partial [Elasticomyces elasticus]
MVTSSGFTNCPVTLSLIAGLIGTSIGASVLDIKHYIPIQPTPHLWPYLQLWRIGTYQMAYTNSSELLFAAALLYQMRVLERLWGSCRFISFVISIYGLTSISTVTVGLILKLITFGKYNYAPAGPTSLARSLLAVWSTEVPRLGGFKVLLDTDEAKIRNGQARMLDISDKWTTYVLVAQSAL